MGRHQQMDTAAERDYGLDSVSFGEALASHANAQAHSASCGLRQSTTLEVGEKGKGENVSRPRSSRRS